MKNRAFSVAIHDGICGRGCRRHYPEERQKRSSFSYVRSPPRSGTSSHEEVLFRLALVCNKSHRINHGFCPLGIDCRYQQAAQPRCAADLKKPPDGYGSLIVPDPYGMPSPALPRGHVVRGRIWGEGRRLQIRAIRVARRAPVELRSLLKARMWRRLPMPKRQPSCRDVIRN